MAVGTIPADQPIDSVIRETLCALFDAAKTKDEQRILLEMAYKPSVTALVQLGQNAGWKSILGLEVLVGQGVHQFEHWTGIKPLYAIAKDAVMSA